MNTMFEILQTKSVETEAFCPIHDKPIVEIAGIRICKECAKETLEEAHLIYEQELKQRLSKQKIKNSGLTQRYQNCGFKSFDITSPSQENAIKLCQAFAQQIISGLSPNLLLVGTPGTGKTHLSASIIRNILHNSMKSARYYTSAEISQKLMDTWSDPSRSESELIHHFTSFDLLVIDEYGLHDRHEKRLEMVHKVLYNRYDNMKPTMLISNFTLQKMQQDLGIRLWSRLHENNLIVVPCYWDDQRLID